MLSMMSAKQLEEWSQFYIQEPWGDWRADMRAGIIASTIANIHRKKDSPVFTPVDFMPFAEKKSITGDEIKGKIDKFMTKYRKA